MAEVTDEEAAALYTAGATLRQVASKLGHRSFAPARAAVLRGGGKIRRVGRPEGMTDAARERAGRIHALYKKIGTLRGVGAKEGISAQAIHDLLVRAGLPRFPVGRRKKAETSPSP